MTRRSQMISSALGEMETMFRTEFGPGHVVTKQEADAFAIVFRILGDAAWVQELMLASAGTSGVAANVFAEAIRPGSNVKIFPVIRREGSAA